MSKRNHLIPFSTIASATDGDASSVNAVLKHYAGYISTLATRTYYDNQGNSRLYVDENLKRKLETKLITKILVFDVAS